MILLLLIHLAKGSTGYSLQDAEAFAVLQRPEKGALVALLWCAFAWGEGPGGERAGRGAQQGKPQAAAAHCLPLQDS